MCDFMTNDNAYTTVIQGPVTENKQLIKTNKQKIKTYRGNQTLADTTVSDRSHCGNDASKSENRTQ